MSDHKWDVVHSDYKSGQEYEAALRDQRKINELLSQYNIETKSGAEKLYTLLQSGKVRFESSLGNRFDDEIYEMHNNPKNQFVEKRKTPDKRAKKKKEPIRLEHFDKEMQENIRREMKKAERKRKIAIAIFTFIGIACIGYVIVYQYWSGKSERRWDDLASLVGSDALVQNSANTQANISIENEDYVIPDVLPQYQTLYNSNQRLIGWLKIDDTIIDYPVMQCDDNTYYLEHNFDQEEDKAGAIFLDCNCDVIRGCDNYIVYGHHLMSGKMFSSLTNYESESYYNTHPYISFDTIYEEADYQIMFVFRSRVYNEDEVCFKYYQFINANSEEEFISYMNEMQQLSFYDTGVTAVYGDQLLTLSTCDYNEPNGRFVVVAKRIN